jgi:hypothetical protein
MSSIQYQKNKESIARWRQKNREKHLNNARIGSKAYYEKNAVEICQKKREKYQEKKLTMQISTSKA